MPNWCFNKVTFTHSDASQLIRAVDAFNRSELFAEFHPCPQDLIDTEADEQQTTTNIDKHGHANWYDWCLSNWGTKWDVDTHGDTVDKPDGDSVELWFDTAWSPPIQFYEQMEKLGFNVDAYYYEPGMGVCGRYTDGDDDYYEIEGDAEWVQENIPGDINDMFSITDNMADWEDEEED